MVPIHEMRDRFIICVAWDVALVSGCGEGERDFREKLREGCLSLGGGIVTVTGRLPAGVCGIRAI